MSDSQPPIRVDIESLAWLAGQWLGTALGGSVEEVWLHPAAGRKSGRQRIEVFHYRRGADLQPLAPNPAGS